MSPVPSLRDHFSLGLAAILDPHAFGLTPRRSDFHHGATLILRLGCSTCSQCSSRIITNATVLLLSRRYRYSPVIQSYYLLHSVRTRRVRQSRAIHTQPRIGVRARPWLFCSRHYCRLFATSIQRPINLHAGIWVSYLILAHYSCRSRSPVSSKARDATPDFTIHRFTLADSHRLDFG